MTDTLCLWIYPARGAWARLMEMTELLDFMHVYEDGTTIWLSMWTGTDADCQRPVFGVN